MILTLAKGAIIAAAVEKLNDHLTSKYPEKPDRVEHELIIAILGMAPVSIMYAVVELNLKNKLFVEMFSWSLVFSYLPVFVAAYASLKYSDSELLMCVCVTLAYVVGSYVLWTIKT